MPTIVEQLQLVRKVVGWSKQRVVANDALTARAIDFVDTVAASGEVDPEPLQASRKMLGHLKLRVLPSEASCRAAQKQLESVLLPLMERQHAGQQGETGGQQFARERG